MDYVVAFLLVLITVMKIEFRDFFFNNDKLKYYYNYLTGNYEDMENKKNMARKIVGGTVVLLILFILLRGGCSGSNEDSQENREPMVNYEKVEEFIIPDVDTSALYLPDATLYYINKFYTDHKDFNKYNEVFVKIIDYKLKQYIDYVATRHTELDIEIWNLVNTKENYERFNNNNNFKKYVMDGLVK